MNFKSLDEYQAYVLSDDAPLDYPEICIVLTKERMERMGRFHR